MKLPSVDLYAGLAYISGGGLAATAVAISSFAPKYTVQILNISAILIGISGLLVRLKSTPTATNTVQVFDRNTGSVVEMKTVKPPSDIPAPAPTYTGLETQQGVPVIPTTKNLT
jgi:hypothetical protein